MLDDITMTGIFFSFDNRAVNAVPALPNTHPSFDIASPKSNVFVADSIAKLSPERSV